jgi:hypothetical protein
MMFCQLQPGSRLLHDEEIALHLVPGGAVRRESSFCRTARRRQGRGGVCRGEACPFVSFRQACAVALATLEAEIHRTPMVISLLGRPT